jgi:hypothetical protein
MRDIKYELQYIILGDGPAGQPDKLKEVETFLSANAGAGIAIEKKQYFKSEEATAPVVFAQEKSYFMIRLFARMQRRVGK